MGQGTKIKILYISHSAHFNGAEICLFNLIDNLERSIFETVVIFPDEGPLKKKVDSLDVKTFIVPLERWIRYKFETPLKNITLISRVNRIADIIERESIDIVHSNTSVILEGAIASKLKNVPHIWHIHEYLKNNPDLSTVLPLPATYEVISALSDKIISVSNFVNKQFESLYEQQKYSTIYNGIRVENDVSSKASLRNEFGVKNEEVLAVTIGVLTESKGYSTLIKAAKITKEKGCKIKYIWVGGEIDGSAKHFKKVVKEFNLEDTFKYVGFREDIPEILNSSDFLICSSVLETLSLSILEAMAAGLPVITTDCGGPAESVIDNETGFIVPVNDPQRMSEKIIELASSVEKRKLFGDNGLKRFEDNFSIKKYVRNFELLYKEAVKIEKLTTPRELALIESLYDLYETVSNEHWKKLKKKK